MNEFSNKMSGNRGFTITEVLFATFILGITASGLMGMSKLSSDLELKYKAKASIFEARSELVQKASNAKNWSATVSMAGTPIKPDSPTKFNPSLECVKKGTACVNGEYELTIFDIDKQVVHDSTDASLGFTRNGSYLSHV